MATRMAPKEAITPPKIKPIGNMYGPKLSGRSAAPRRLSLTNKLTVKTEAPYAPRAMMGAGKLAHVTIDHIQAQCDEDGDQDQPGDQETVVADISPDMQDKVQPRDMQEHGIP